MRSDAAAHEAFDLAQRAVALDPTFADAHALLARLYLRIGPPGELTATIVDRLQRARQHAARAVELDSLFPGGHGVLGIAHVRLYSFDEAEGHLKKAIALDPADSQAREWLVQLHVWQGRWSDALAAAESAIVADPLSSATRAELARGLLVNGRCGQALAELEPLSHLEPSLLRADHVEAQCHAQMGLWDEAVADIARGLPRAGVRGRATWAFYQARAGRRDVALDVLAELRNEASRGDEGAFWVGLVLAGLGELDEAFVWLNRAVEDYSLTGDVREPMFSPLHGDPRFGALLARLDLEAR